MVILISTMPLFSRVAISADLRNVATSAPDGQNITVQALSTSPTKQQAKQIRQQLDLTLQRNGFETYIQRQVQHIIQTPAINILTTNPGKINATSTKSGEIVLDGYDPTLAAQHVAIMQGHLPSLTSDGSIEIALTQEVATDLQVHVGTVLQGVYPTTLDSQIHLWSLRVVGIIAPKFTHDLFHTNNFNPFGIRYTQENSSIAYSVLAAEQTVSEQSAGLQTTTQRDGTLLAWSYPFDISQLDANNISQLSQQTSNLSSDINSTLTRIDGVTSALLIGTLFDVLSRYDQKIVLLSIVLIFLLFIILAIVLFLLSMLSDMLVEQQREVIAILRSRGATRRHIFGTFVMQSIVLSLAALLLGPWLSLLLVRMIAQILLPSVDHQAPVLSPTNHY